MTRLRDLAATLLIACAVSAGCGKKGPPLTPIIRIPVAVDALTPRRVGDDVYVTFTVPRLNIDASTPASIAKVEVYAATALTPPTRARFLEIATLVGTIPVAPDADPANPGAVMPPPDPKAGALQGTPVTVRDVLTPEAKQPRELPLLEEERRAAATPVGGIPIPRVTALRRFYMAIPYNGRGQPGPPSPVIEMPLTILPDPPTGLQTMTSATTVTLQFEPAGGLIGWLMDQSLPVEPPPLADQLLTRVTVAPVSDALPPGPTRYNVYREIAPDPLLLPSEQVAVMPWNAPAPQPLNAAPLAALTYVDPIVLDERERCYSVRALRGAVESASSARECVTPIDIYPPAAPTDLQTVIGDGRIDLIWSPNGEEDLGGYIVLRVAAGGDTLLQLTATPIRDARYTDRTVTPGVRYTYVVRAVDSRVPAPNMSDPAEVSDTAQ